MRLARPDGLVLTDDPADLQLDRILDWLGRSYWAADRDRGTIERSITGSRSFGVYGESGQVGFARAVTDGATFAWIADVFVDESSRGRGIGRWLVGSIVDELSAAGVQRFVLATRDAHGVYAALGFEPLLVPEIWMEIDRRANRARPGDVRDPSTVRAVDRESASDTL